MFYVDIWTLCSISVHAHFFLMGVGFVYHFCAWFHGNFMLIVWLISVSKTLSDRDGICEPVASEILIFKILISSDISTVF